jgi:transcriptional regulator GlxA family with amidase domain
MRVEATQQMIDSSNIGLKEIADACGFRRPCDAAHVSAYAWDYGG